MRKAILCFLFLSALLVISIASAFADTCHTVNTEYYWDNNITSGYLAQAQTFEAPSAVCSILSDWQFRLAGRTSPGQVTFNIYQWGSQGPIGNPLFSENFAWGTTDQVFNVTGINMSLTPGQLYGADIDLQGYSGQSVYYNGNDHGYRGYDGWWNDPNAGWFGIPGTNQYFIADFADVPEPGTLLLFGSSMLTVLSGSLVRWRSRSRRSRLSN